MSLVKTTLNNITQPHIPLGISQGYAQHQLGFGSRLAAGFANLFGGSNQLNSDIGVKFTNLKNEALQNLENHAKTNFPTCNCIAGIQFELLNLEINEGQDTILICNVTGTAIKIRSKKKKPKPHNVGGSRLSHKKVKRKSRRPTR
ncbi:MAG TPA: heavy metal-binding domain-containing protein [Chromatiaceae bacterium]|nr:heavy metal-binding domain-containing protein [Chromatiaceae bacterium]